MKRWLSIAVTVFVLLNAMPCAAEEAYGSQTTVLQEGDQEIGAETQDTSAPMETPTESPTQPPMEESTEQPTEAPTEQPTEKPTEKPAEQPTEDPTEAPTQQPGEAPSENPSQQPTQSSSSAPGESVKPENTPAPPETSASAAPSESPAAEPSETPIVVPEDAEAWTYDGETLIWGKLDEVVALRLEKEDRETPIYLRRGADKPYLIKQAQLLELFELKFMPDEELFKADARVRYDAAFSLELPETGKEMALIDPKRYLEQADPERPEESIKDIYIWVQETALSQPTEEPSQEPSAEPSEEPTQSPEPKPELNVTSETYRANEWSNVFPTFELSGGEEGRYAVIVYDERIAVLSGSSYTAESEGEYAVRFAIVDEHGDIVSASEKYLLKLDVTAPDVAVSVDPELAPYTLSLAASDEGSGVKDVSVDGGETWMELAEDGTFVYTVQADATLDPGMVRVRDAAGNEWVSEEAYELTAPIIEPDEPIDDVFDDPGSVGSGGGGSSKPKEPEHAKNEDKKAEETEYDALMLEFSEEPMEKLTLGETELPLTLELVNAEGFETPEDHVAKFTAELKTWTPPEDSDAIVDLGQKKDAAEEKASDKKASDKKTSDKEDEDGEACEGDTLVLTAVLDEDMGDRFEYRWKFNGEVYRLLANSGVKYVALCVGDDMFAFPTEGFHGGTKYTELKMLGVATKKFNYTVAMTFNLDPDRIPMISQSDFSEGCDIAIQAEVENMKYVLSAEEKGEMYYYNAYIGPLDMLDFPYGTYGEEVLEIQTAMASEEAQDAHD